VLPGKDRLEAIASMPGIERQSIDLLARRVERDLELGVRSAILFGVPEGPKDSTGSSSYAPDALVPRAVAALKRSFGHDLVLHCDVCLCAYTDHGHCGLLETGGGLEKGDVLNDPSLEPLARQAVACAAAGADFVAPSDMMDGRVGAIREALDREGFSSVGILAYTAKYASAYYGPFREAAHSAPASGDRRSYQMDPRNRREALREAALDEAEGADILMVKPALAYLDVIAEVRARTTLPLAAYNVSGEYALVKAAAAAGWVDEGAVVVENLNAIARAGADLILTYHAREACERSWL
jgi:porphobilinogen synthase